ncbi:MAG: caffeoyl-CoA O-methyltransferase [Limisphaerales bacterium]|jgi:caffeoyl-CoA O-methyltransferase
MKYLSLNDELYNYATQWRSDADDTVLQELRKETAALGDDARMQISVEQGAFMRMLAGTIGARSAIEVGTFTGYSALCVAQGLPADGRLICLDIDDDWTGIARKYWDRAGVAEKIDLRIGPAIQSLENLETNLQFDLAFIDADKTEYDAYYELILPRIRQNGLLLFDNMLWGGDLIAENLNHPSGLALNALNQKLTQDPRVENVLLPFADGIQMCRKL